jgi:hypothetical protein
LRGPEPNAKRPVTPRADAFALHATILRRQLEGMLASGSTTPDDEAVALAGLFSHVFDQPHGRWDA